MCMVFACWKISESDRLPTSITPSIVQFVRPSMMVAVCGDQSSNNIRNLIQFIDLERNVLLHEVRTRPTEDMHNP